MRYLLALDSGTSSGRAVLFDLNGTQVAVAQEEWLHHEEPGFPGSMNFDCSANWALLARSIRKVLHDANIDPADILGISATSMREGIVLYDEAGRELWGCANVDARTDEQVRFLKNHHPDLEERFYQVSGQTFALGGLPRLLWVQQHRPDLYDRVRSVSMIGDWALMKLSGELVSDPSNAGTTGIFSLHDRTWAPDMCRQVGLRDDIFPPVAETGTVIGRVTRQAADETGLAVGTPVVVGGGDVQLGCAGLGVVRPGQCAVLGGTFWQELVNMAEPITDPGMKIRVNPHVVPGQWQAEAIVFFVGFMTRWFRDAFCQEEVRIAKERGVDVYELLEEQAREVPVGSHGILPIFSDVMRYNRWYHAAPSLLNLSLDPVRSGKAAIFRALQENAAIVTAVNLDNIFSFTGVTSEELVFAGGASKGTLWSQILADVTGMRVRVPRVREAPALGAAVAAGVGVGAYATFPEAMEELVDWEHEFEPDAEHHAIYREVRDRWQAAYAAQRQLVDAGVTSPMWKAPGITFG